MTRLFGLVAIGTLTASAAQAQACMGYPTFGSGGKNVSAQAYLPDGSTTVLGQLNLGKDNGTFVGVNAGFTSIDGGDVTPITVGGMMGFERMAGKISWCPVGTAAYRTEAKDFNLSAGISAATQLFDGGAFKVSPVASARMNYFKPDVGDADGWLLYGVGVAFSLNNGIVLAPSFDLSSQEDSDGVLGLRVSLPLGGR
jgi:hypothetical protein